MTLPLNWQTKIGLGAQNKKEGGIYETNNQGIYRLFLSRHSYGDSCRFLVVGKGFQTLTV